MENLPGVDPNSDAVQQAMGAMKKKDEEDKDKKKKEEEDKDKKKKEDEKWTDKRTNKYLIIYLSSRFNEEENLI